MTASGPAATIGSTEARMGLRRLLWWSWTMTRRDWRAGELTTLAVAIVLAVAALTSVGFLADRMQQGLSRDARQMLGADLRIRADHPIDPRFVDEARRRGLRIAVTTIFPSMAAAVAPPTNAPALAPAAPAVGSPAADAGDPLTRLAAVKAVSSAYPLRGAVTISAAGVPRRPASPNVHVSGSSADGRVANAGLVTGNGANADVADARGAHAGVADGGGAGAGVTDRRGASTGVASGNVVNVGAGALAPGTVWVDASLLDALHLRIGDALQLGNRTFTIAAVITRELDRGFSFINFSPRVMLRDGDLPSTGLIGRGSRVTYRLLVAGENGAALDSYRRWASQLIATEHLRGVAVESLSEGLPQVTQTLDRANRFLRLVALLTALLAAVAIAMAAQRYARRHIDGCAVIRCLGASARSLRVMFVCTFVTVALGAGLLGSAIGFLGHWVLLQWLGSLINVDLPMPTLWPVAQGIGVALVLLLGFALPPLLPLTRVPPGRVLRRDWGEGQMSRRGYVVGYGSGIVLFAGLLIWGAGEITLGLIVAGGFVVGMLLFGGLGWLALKGLAAFARRTPRAARSELSAASARRTGETAQPSAPLSAGSSAGSLAQSRARRRFGWRYALASLERRGAASAVQITALGIALMCLMLLGMTRNDLVAGWRRSTPPDAPNRFIIDIQPEQRADVMRALGALGLPSDPPSPMIRGRLTAHNGVSIDPAQFRDDRVKRLVDREFNLSYRATLPSDNRIAAGRWYGDTAQPQISMEAGIAKDLGVHVGDTLRFDVAGQTIDAPVTSLRKLDWGSFRVNFFVLMPPAALADFPATFITSLHVEPPQQAAIDRLLRQYPNLTVIDTGAIMAQLQRVLNQVIAAIQFLFLFTLAAGAVVLYAALAGSRDERSRESALLRALGASHRQVRVVQFAEFIVVGALAGLMAAVGAEAIGALLAQRVFDFTLTPNPWLLATGVAAGLLCSIVGGSWSLRQVLNRPALQSLRDA